jgi:succinoglycan biosynthesis transport protein ExoP
VERPSQFQSGQPRLYPGQPRPEQNQIKTVHLSEYYQILLKHRAIIISTLMITVTLTALFTFLMKPVYQATATLIIEKEKSTSPLTGERVDYESYVSQSLTFNTHFKLITAIPVLVQTIRDLELDREGKTLQAGLFGELKDGIKNNIRLLLGREETYLSDSEKMTLLAEDLEAQIEIEEVRDTRLLKVKIEDYDPVLARDIANRLAENYIKYSIDNRLKSSQNTLGWMSNHLYEVKKKLEDAEREFQEYKEVEKLFSIEGKQKMITQKIEEFNDAYLDTRNRRLELDAKLNQLQKSSRSGQDIVHVRSIIDNPMIENLFTQLHHLDLEASRASKIYKAKHPRMIQAMSKLENTQENLKAEIDKEVENLKVERSVLAAREQVLQKTMGDFENDALATNRKELNYSILKRDVDTNQKLYDTLLTKIKETDLVNNFDVSNVRIADRAHIPLQPEKPKKKLNIVLSIIFGFMTGVGLAFLLDYADQSLRTGKDVERYLGLPVLAVIPLADTEKFDGAAEAKAQHA